MQDKIRGVGVSVVLTVVSLSAFIGVTPAEAVRNANGVILLHTDDTVVYTKEDGDGFGPSSELTCPGVYQSNRELADCFDCEARMQRLNPTSGRGSDPVVWWALLAFPEESEVRVSAVALGHRWTGDLEILDYGVGADMLDVPDPTWPFQSGTGVGIGWAFPQRSQMMEIYWMAGYVESGEALLEIIPHPAQGAAVADDARHIEPLVSLGTLGLGGAEGSNPLPIAEPFGACCLGSGICVPVQELQCEQLAGVWIGDACDAGPCDPGDAQFVLEEMDSVLEVRDKEVVVHPIRIRNDGEDPLRVRFQLDPGPLPPIDADFSAQIYPGRTVPLLRDLVDSGIVWDVGTTGPLCDGLRSRLVPWVQGGGGLLLRLDRPFDIDVLESLEIYGVEVVPSEGAPETTTDIVNHLSLRGIDTINLPARTVRLEGSGAGTAWMPLVRDTEGRIVMAVARVGIGRVFLSAVSLRDLGIASTVRQWFAGTDRGRFEPESLVLAPGESGDALLSFPPFGLFDGNYQIAVEAVTNDANQPFVRLPVNVGLEMGDDGLWVTDGLIDFRTVTRLVPAEAELDLVNLSAEERSIVLVECSDPRIVPHWSSETLVPGGTTTVRLDLFSEEIGEFEASLAITSSTGFRRYVVLRGEVVEEPKFELLSGAVLVPIGPWTGVGSFEFRNAAQDPRAVLEWQVEVPLAGWSGTSTAGSCGFPLGTSSPRGELPPQGNERVGLATQSPVVPGTVCSILIRTNDPSHPTVEIPVRIGDEGEPGQATRDLERLDLIDDVATAELVPHIRLESAHPCRNEALFALDISQPDGSHFDIYDATGRVVWSAGSFESAGTHIVTWTGESADGRVPTGVYWGVLRTSRGNAVKRLVFVR